jgi:hypothetical protein
MAATLVQKLQLKASMSLVVLNAPAGYMEHLAQELPGNEVTLYAGGDAQAVLAFVNTLAEAEKLALQAAQAVGPDGLLWIAYPKGSSGVQTDVNRDKLWPVLETQGWRSVRLVALDEVWSAMRFRPEASVKG